MPRLTLRRLAGLLVVLAFGAARALAQHPTFTPDRPSGAYAVGERVGWTVARPAPGRPRKDAPANPYTYVVRRDGGDTVAAGRLDLADGRARIETSLSAPGMLLVEVRPARPDSTFGARGTGGPGRVLLGAAISPAGIRPAEPPPADFGAFWAGQIARLDSIPVNPVVSAKPSGREGVEYATVRLDNVDGAHVWGQMARPSAPGRYPALVIYQWASPPYPLQPAWVTDRAAEGWLVLNVEPHDVPGDMPQAFYDALPALVKKYETIGHHRREDSHFLRMYLGDHRAVEWLASRPEWDGRTMVVMGTSMGGQQSLAIAGLNRRVTAVLANVPAGADVTARLHGRAPSYPFWDVARADVLATARYFDVASFTPRITAPALVAMGYIDEVCTPTGIWAAFNAMSGPKEAAPMVDSPHNHLATAEASLPWTRRSAAWLAALVRGRDPMAPSAR